LICGYQNPIAGIGGIIPNPLACPLWVSIHHRVGNDTRRYPQYPQRYNFSNSREERYPRGQEKEQEALEKDKVDAGISAGIAGMVEPEISALSYLQSIYRDPLQPTSARMRAAALAVPFESAKLAVTAHVADDDFGTQLEQAIERSRNASKLIEAKPIQYASTTTSDLNNK
jgi:hypothetical protein